MTEQQLVRITAELPGEIGSQILADPGEFLDLIHQITRQPGEWMWLVDKAHSLPIGYEPADLVDLKNHPVKITKDSLFLRASILEDFLKMIKAAESDEVELVCASAYRSFSYQEGLFNYWVKKLGREQAEQESARAGTSQHQLGTTIDFYPIDETFTKQPAYNWLLTNGWKYGFTLSYPDGYLEETGYKFEPWHWRYIGKPAAEICVKYFNNIQQYWLEFWYQYSNLFLGKLIIDTENG